MCRLFIGRKFRKRIHPYILHFTLHLKRPTQFLIISQISQGFMYIVDHLSSLQNIRTHLFPTLYICVYVMYSISLYNIYEHKYVICMYNVYDLMLLYSGAMMTSKS